MDAWIDGPIKEEVAAMHARRDAWAAERVGPDLDRRIAHAAVSAAQVPTTRPST